MGIENITPPEFLESARRAAGNLAAMPAFRQMVDEIRGSPETRQRLVFDFLHMATRLLAARGDPGEPILWAVRWRDSVEKPRMPEYLTLLEQVLAEYFQILGRAAPGLGLHPWVLTLALGLGAISDSEEKRFLAVLERLRGECRHDASDARRDILAEAEKLVQHRSRGGPKALD